MNTRPILDNMNLSLLGLGFGTIMFAFVFAAIGTAYVLKRARGTIQEPSIRRWSKVGWALFAVYMVGYMVYFYKKSEPVVIAYPFTAGDKALDRGDYKAALEDYQAVLKQYPNLGLAHYKLGMLYRVVKQVDASVAELKKAIAVDPQLAPAYFALGSILWTRGTAMDAMPYFEKGLTLNPKTPEKAFFLDIIDRGKKEKAGVLKPGSTGRPLLSPPGPGTPLSPSSGAKSP